MPPWRDAVARWMPAALFVLLPLLLIHPGFQPGKILFGTDVIGGFYHLRGAIGAANGIHLLLEAQEYATDIFCGTHNVRGAWDSAGDLGAGLLGTVLYARAATPRR